MQHNEQALIAFQHFIWSYYRDNKRFFTWRHTHDPYHIVVSEIMLQQTQTYRVEPKFEQFIIEFPNFESLAHAPLRDVLGAWQGLGYNRRGKALHEIAKKVMAENGGTLPQDPTILVTFPGIGKATAASICAFAFNMPTIFIETNIRAVYIESFFKGKTEVHDKEILPLVAATVDHENPREWYYALMDYGVYLKKKHKNPSRRSAHHSTQSRFEGSDRQIRGLIIKLLTQYRALKRDELIESVQKETTRVEKIVDQLRAEGFIKQRDNVLEIA